MLSTATQLLLREKSCVKRVGTGSNIPSLPVGSIKFIWWKLKMSSHTAYPIWNCPAVVSHLFLYSFICTPATAFTWLSKFCTLQLSSVFLPTYLGTLLVHFWKGTYNFQKLFKNTIYIGVCTLKCTKKMFHPLQPPFIFSLLKEALNMPPGMYCIIRLSGMMRLSEFKYPLFYPPS